MSRKRLLAGLILVAFGGAAVFLARRQESAPSPSEAAFRPLTLGCEPGRSWAYELSYLSRGRFDSAAVFPADTGRGGAPAENALELEGILRIDCVKVEPGRGELLALAFLRAKGTASGFGMEAVAPEALVGETAYVRRRSNGVIGEIVFPEAWSGTLRNVVRDVIAHQSFALEAKASWTSREEDLNGVYRARYAAAAPSPDEARLTKTRLAYEAAGGGDAQIRVEPGSTAELSFAVKGSVIVAIGRLRSTVKLSFLRGDSSFGESESSLRLAPLEGDALATTPAPKVVDVDALVSQQSDRLGDLAGRDAQRRIDEIMHREKLGKDDADSLDLALQDSASGAKPSETFLKLRALFILQPETCRRFAARLLELDRKDPRFGAILSALADAGHAEAQAALVDALAGLDFSLDKQLLVLSQLGLLEHATVETEEAVRSYTSEVRDADLQQTARLALGNMARRLAPSDLARAKRITAEALADYHRADAASAKFHALMTLGNIGHSELLDEVQADLSAEDATVRSAAVTALRFVDAPGAEGTLAAALTDKTDQVRAAAVDSLSYRDLSPEGRTALERRLTQEPDEHTRILILRALAKYTKGDDALLAVIEDRKQNDPAESVREFADSILVR